MVKDPKECFSFHVRKCRCRFCVCVFNDVVYDVVNDVVNDVNSDVAASKDERDKRE